MTYNSKKKNTMITNHLNLIQVNKQVLFIDLVNAFLFFQEIQSDSYCLIYLQKYFSSIA